MTSRPAPLAEGELRVYRYLIQPYPHDVRVDPVTGRQWHGCLALAIARSQEEAYAILQQRAMEEGDPWEWLALADVTTMPITPSRLVWADL